MFMFISTWIRKERPHSFKPKDGGSKFGACVSSTALEVEPLASGPTASVFSRALEPLCLLSRLGIADVSPAPPEHCVRMLKIHLQYSWRHTNSSDWLHLTPWNVCVSARWNKIKKAPHFCQCSGLAGLAYMFDETDEHFNSSPYVLQRPNKIANLAMQLPTIRNEYTDLHNFF